MGRLRRIASYGAAALAACLVGAPGVLASDLRVEVTPTELEIATFSGRPQVLITATVDPGAAAIVVVRGKEAESVFNQKVRVGPIWLNSGRVHVAETPTLFMCYSPGPVAALLARADIDRYDLDAAAIRQRMRVTPAAADREEIRDSYLALQLQNRSYRFIDGGEGAMAAGANPGTYSVVVPWPATAPPDRYEAVVYECAGQRVVRTAVAPFSVVRGGATAWLANAAVHNAPLYGVVAVSVAMSLGFGVDFLVTYFRRRGARRGGPEERQTGIPAAH
jgi:hypothetical protein